ncbi:MAG TPA: MG2 domain-containing protein, partial [Flavobacteriales bacterium]
MMPSLIRSRYRLLLTAAVIATTLLHTSCSRKSGEIRPDPAFAPYIPAFTSGHIPARASILVRISDDQAFKDTSAAALQKLFKLAPAVEGSVVWQDERTLAFKPNTPLKQDRTYAVDFHLGQLIEVPEALQEFRFSVTTFRQGIDVRISDMQSLSPTDLTWQRVQLSVYTSDFADGEALARCFKATQSGRDLKVHWEHAPDGSLHRAVADSVQRGDRPGQVLFRWDGGAIDSKDKGDTTFTVPALGDLVLLSSSTTSEGEQSATLLFSDPLDAGQDLAGIAGITGSEEVRVSVDGNKLMLHPQEHLSGTQQAFISAGLMNVMQRKLGTDLTVDLEFEDIKPNVRLVGNGTILPSTDGLLFPFEAVNLNAVDVRIVRIYADNVPQFLQVNQLNGENELARAGRLLKKTVVRLDGDSKPEPGRWTRYFLDLDRYIRTEPGAIYRVILGFRREYSTYPCEGATVADVLTSTAQEEEAEEEGWDEPYGYYYEGDYYSDGEEYDYREREEPCSPSYFHNKSQVAQRNILASDLGLIAKRGNDGSLFLAASDLRSAEPMGGVKMQVLDLQRRVLGEVTTNGQGTATLASTKHKPFLIVASKGDQRGYLKVDEGTALSVSEMDVQGEQVDKGLKGFLYGERGVWRPGDSLYLTFILQNTERKLPKEHPVSLELTDPQGRLDQRLVRTTSVNGTYSFRCATDADAPTGIWNARVTVGGTSFHKSLRIETVKPNRLKIALDLGGDLLTVNDERRAKLQSNWLHGAPARDLAARVTVSLTRASAVFKDHPKFQFDDLRTDLNAEEITVYDGHLDAEGRTDFPFKLDLNGHAPAAVNANIVTRVFEAGGDASMDRTDVVYRPYSSYAGVQVPEADGYWGNHMTDTTYRITALSVNANGKAMPGRTLRAQVVKVSYNWWWHGDMDDEGSYMTASSSRVLVDTMITTGRDGTTTFPFRIDRPEWGRFVVRLSDPGSGHVSAAEMYLDWPGYSGRSRRQGEKEAAMLRFNSDKDNYNVGDRCTLIIPSATKGRALVSLETGSRVIQAEWVELKDKETRYSFDIKGDMAPNIYAHVMLVQPHSSTSIDNDLPIRLYGVIPIKVQDLNTHLAPLIAMPKELKTDVPFTVEVGEKSGKAMTYTLAIVDEGLLDLTRFKTPDPWNHFYAREALGVRTWDLYDHVIGAMGRQLQRVLAIGGSDQVDPNKAAKVNRFKPVVRFVGPFRLAKGAKAKHSFTIDNYVGSVRVMVVANDGDRAYGSTEQTAPVKKALMVLATMPRVTGPGETVDLPVNVFAMDPKVKNVTVRLKTNELFTVEGGASRDIVFDRTGDQVVTFRVKVADRIGSGSVEVTAEGAGEKAKETIAIAVRQPNQPETDVTEGIADVGGTWSGNTVPLGVIGTNSAYVEVSTIPKMDLGRRLQYLIDYPHGCVEQTTSKAFPQLFLANVIDVNDRTAANMRGNVEAGLRRLKQFQHSSGGFAYWPGMSETDDWSSVWVGHFITEAERAGFALPEGMKASWLNYMRRVSRDWTNASAHEYWSLQAHQLTQAYRLYVLALSNNADANAMNRLRTGTDLHPTARWMLAAAYALNNRKDVAREITKGLTTEVGPYTETGWTYGSDLRDAAIIAEALYRMDDRAGAAGIVKRIAERMGSDGWYATQTTAWGLLAVSHVTSSGEAGNNINVSVTVDGTTKERASSKGVMRIELPEGDRKHDVRIQNKGKGLLYVRTVRTGTPLFASSPAASHGLAMDVRYVTMDDKPIDPSRLEQGT